MQGKRQREHHHHAVHEPEVILIAQQARDKEKQQQILQACAVALNVDRQGEGLGRVQKQERAGDQIAQQPDIHGAGTAAQRLAAAHALVDDPREAGQHQQLVPHGGERSRPDGTQEIVQRGIGGDGNEQQRADAAAEEPAEEKALAAIAHDRAVDPAAQAPAQNGREAVADPAQKCVAAIQHAAQHGRVRRGGRTQKPRKEAVDRALPPKPAQKPRKSAQKRARQERRDRSADAPDQAGGQKLVHESFSTPVTRPTTSTTSVLAV